MESSESRKERLKALKEAKELLDGEHGQPVLRFRNYELRDDGIQHIKAQPLPSEEPSLDPTTRPDLLTEGLADVAPKKLNFDLKRDVDARLQLLERKTQRALTELQRQEERGRMEREGGVADEEGSSETASDSDGN